MSHFPDFRLDRRRLASLAAATGAVSVMAPRASATAGAPTVSEGALGAGVGPTRRYRLRRDRDSAVAALDLPLATAPGLSRGRGSTRSRVIETDGFSMVGITWKAGGGVVRARCRRRDGSWTPWQELPTLHDAPDDGEPTRDRRATELAWFGRCEAVQLELPAALRGPELALIDPGELATDADDVDDVVAGRATTDDTSDVRARSRKRRRPPRPGMRSRRKWGAPRQRYRIRRTKNIRQMHVHHTVSTNRYRKRDVPGMIRGMHRYHTQNLGWSDIGYNFLVDKYGRVWVGRRGSVWKEARGAHTRGFNNTSFGVAVIGNFQRGRPSNQVLHGLKRLAAWKLAQHRLDPTARLWTRSEGSDRYPAGKGARLPVISGHRHTNQTACPGWFLHRELPRLRRMTERRIRRFQNRSR